MARERMVTRTVENAKIEVLRVNTSTREIGNSIITISNTIPDEKRMKYIQKHFDNDEVKTVSILNVTVEETLYGMSEQEFISMAKVLPPRTNAKGEDK